MVCQHGRRPKKPPPEATKPRRSAPSRTRKKGLALRERPVTLRPMQTWVVCARSPSGEERPIGLVEASGEQAALFRARTKVSHLLRASDHGELVVRPARTGN